MGRLRRALEEDWRIAIAEPTRRVRGSVWECARIESGMGLVAMCYCTIASHGRTLDIRKARQGKGGLTRERVVVRCGPAAVAHFLCQHRQDHASGSGNGSDPGGLNSTLVDKTSSHPSHQHICSVSPTRYPPIKSTKSLHILANSLDMVFNRLTTNHDRPLFPAPLPRPSVSARIMHHRIDLD